jgi:hypothetical protein
MALDMVDVAIGNQVIFEHLMVDFHCAHDNQANEMRGNNTSKLQCASSRMLLCNISTS